MTIFNKIAELANEKFEALWVKEVARITNMYNGYKASGLSTEKYAFSIIAPNKNYNTVRISEYNQIKSTSSMMSTIDYKGLGGFFAAEKQPWFESLTEKLNTYAAKFLTLEDTFIDGELMSSVKGYTMRVYFTRGTEKKLLETICFPAGGHSVQSFHYRYKGKLY